MLGNARLLCCEQLWRPWKVGMPLSLLQKSFADNVRISLERTGAPQQDPGHEEV